MLKLFVISTLTALALGTPLSVEPKIGMGRIVGGEEAEPHTFPWQISLQYRDFIIGPYYHTCGATIIDENHIACAAHCISGRKDSHFQVVAGAHNIHAIEDSKQKVKVSAMWHHEDYHSDIFTNDVSLLRLEEPLVFNEYVQPMRLAEQGSDAAPGAVCINSGWGSTSHTTIPSMPNNLQFVELPIVSRDTCQDNYNGINGVDMGMVCAGVPEGGVSSCSGDSGGPLICPDADGEWYLAGIVSWGMIPCGQPNYPTVFANVGNFRDWFDSHISLP